MSSLLRLLLLLLLSLLLCSIDIPGMFEAKGVTNAKERLQLLVGDVRQPFPAAAQEAQVGTQPPGSSRIMGCDHSCHQRLSG